MSLDKCRELYHPFLMRLLTKGLIPQLGSTEDGDIDLKLTRHLAVVALVMELLCCKKIYLVILLIPTIYFVRSFSKSHDFIAGCLL